MVEAADSKRRFRRISAAGIFFQGGAAAVDTSTVVAAGDRAEDVFLVSEESLSNQRVLLMLEQDLLDEMHV